MTAENPQAAEADRMKNLEEDRIRQRMLGVERRADQAQNRARLLGFGLVIALILASIAAFSPHLLAVGGDDVALGTVTAHSFVLTDVDGTPRGQWRVDEDGNSRITVLDRQGRIRMSLSVLSNGSPGMSLSNANGEGRVGLALLPDETPRLAFADETGQPRAVLGLSRSYDGEFLMADAQGETQIFIGMDAFGEASILIPEAAAESVVGEGGS